MPIRIMYFNSKKYIAFLSVLKSISNIDEYASVLILGRNNKDIETILLDNQICIDYKESDDHKKTIKVIDFPNMKITYCTVHSSKGLEDDYVIIINADDSRTGFPNKTEDDSLLDLVLSSKSEFEFDEERRLWYVALTRTRSYTYILANKDNPSTFVNEIKDRCFVMNQNDNSFYVNTFECPRCKSGRLIQRQNIEKKNKFYGCSNYPYCKYTIEDYSALKKNKRCKICGDYLVYRKGRYGPFYGCHNYPRCNYKEEYVGQKPKYN